MIKGKKSFENSKKVVQAALDADVNRKASTVKEESLKNKNKALGESILKETFENSINAQTNKSKTELVEPQKSQCLYGSKLMSLMDESSSINLKCEKEKAHNDPRSCPMFLKYEKKHEKLMPSLKCEENGIYNDLSSETKSLKYEKIQIKHDEDGIKGKGFESDSDGAVDITILNTKAKVANAEAANVKDSNAEDANAKDANDKVANITVAPDKDAANQLKKLLKRIKIKSRKVAPIKLTSRRVSLEKLISFVVYTTGHITGYSVNMARWAGRASMVIVNQEEKDMNIGTSKNDKGVNCAVLDAALGDSKMYKPLFKAAMKNLFWETLLKLFSALPGQK